MWRLLELQLIHWVLSDLGYPWLFWVGILLGIVTYIGKEMARDT